MRRTIILLLIICLVFIAGCGNSANSDDNTQRDDLITKNSTTPEDGSTDGRVGGNEDATQSYVKNGVSIVDLKGAFQKEHDKEKIVYFFEEDYDGDGINEAFVITDDDVEIRKKESELIDGEEEDIENINYDEEEFIAKIWFVDCNGKTTPMNYDESLVGRLSKEWAKENAPYLSAGKQKFIVWEDSRSRSRIFGVRNQSAYEAYEPKVSGKYQYFWKYSPDYDYLIDDTDSTLPSDRSFDGYAGLVNDFSGDTIERIPEYLDFDEKSGEFISNSRIVDGREKCLKEQEKVKGNLSSYLGKDIYDSAKDFENMEEYEPEIGIGFENDYLDLYCEDDWINTLIFSIDLKGNSGKYNIYGLRPGMSFDEAKSICNKIGDPDDYCNEETLYLTIEKDKSLIVSHENSLVTEVLLMAD